MPYVDIHCVDDYASIYYTTNTPHGNVSGFHPDKPTIIILHPLFLDSSWLQHQFGDPRLSLQYNMIAFDMRVCGKSSARPSGRHDSWVDSADLAFCHQRLHLPPCHVLALEGISINCALRFAVLFPEMCLSLTMCNVPAPTEIKWVHTAYDELLQNWCHAEDLESFEHVAKEAVTFIVGPNCEIDLQDDLIAFWETTMPPSRIHRVAETSGVLMNRIPLKPEILASIAQPVLLIHGEKNETCPRKYAERLAAQLVSAEGGAVLFTVKGAEGTLSIVPTNASLVNKVFSSFLSRQPHVGSKLVPSEYSIRERMKGALSTLAGFIGDSGIASRDPSSSLSFSCLPLDIVNRQSATLKHYCKGLHTAFSPVGSDGKPIRKFSDKKSEHWFHSENAPVGTLLSTEWLNQPERERSEKLGHYEKPRYEKPVSFKDHHMDERLRRTNHNSNSHERPSSGKAAPKPIAQMPRHLA